MEERLTTDQAVAGSSPATDDFFCHLSVAIAMTPAASLAQSVERKALNLVVVGSSPTGGGYFPGGQIWRCRVSIPVPLAC